MPDDQDRHVRVVQHLLDDRAEAQILEPAGAPRAENDHQGVTAGREERGRRGGLDDPPWAPRDVAEAIGRRGAGRPELDGSFSTRLFRRRLSR